MLACRGSSGPAGFSLENAGVRSWQRARSLVHSGLLLALGTAAALALGEVAVRLVRPQARVVISPGLYEADPPGRYRLHPGYRGTMTNRTEFRHRVSINAAGLRGAEVEAKRARRPRVLAIGDSFTFGMGVEDGETFAALLPAELAKAGVEAEALNGGLPGTGIPDLVDWLERHGQALRPDLVVLAVFVGNDLTDALPGRDEIEIRDGRVGPRGAPAGLRAWLHRRSHLFLLVKNALSQPATMPLRRAVGLGEPYRLRTLRREFAVYSKTPGDELAAATAATDEALGRLAELAGERGFRLAAMLIPGEVQVDAARWRASLETLGLDPATVDPAAPTRVFADLLAGRGIPWLDLTGAIAAVRAARARIYYREDRHWTPAGHALAAAELAAFLARQGLVAAAPDAAEPQRRAGGHRDQPAQARV